MKFWVIESGAGETIGCELTKRAAEQTAKKWLGADGEFTVNAVDVQVTAESIRRLLGNIGGFAE